MEELEIRQKEFDLRELINTVAAIDPNLRARIVIVIVMRTYKSFSKLTEAKCFGERKTAYLAQKPEAIRVMENAIHLFDDVPHNVAGF
jgi:hypothetical protein